MQSRFTLTKKLTNLLKITFWVFFFRLDTFCFSSSDIFRHFRGILELLNAGVGVMIYTRAFADLSAPRTVEAYRVIHYYLQFIFWKKKMILISKKLVTFQKYFFLQFLNFLCNIKICGRLDYIRVQSSRDTELTLAWRESFKKRDLDFTRPLVLHRDSKNNF